MANSTPTIKFYNFGKRSNSTKKPEDDNLSALRTVQFKLKGPYDFRAPRILISNDRTAGLCSPTGNYAIIEGMPLTSATGDYSGEKSYYYVIDVQLNSNKTMWVSLSLDIYATYSNIFNNLEGTVNYTTNVHYWNQNMDDPRMTFQNFSTKYNLPSNPIDTDYINCNLFGLTGDYASFDGDYSMTVSRFQTTGGLKTYIMSYNNLIWLINQLIDQLNSASTSDVPSKDFKFYVSSSYLYHINMNNTPFNFSQMSMPTSITFVGMDSIDTTGKSIYIPNFAPLVTLAGVHDAYNTANGDPINLWETPEANGVHYPFYAATTSDMPYFLRKNKYRKIQIVTPFDTQDFDQDDCGNIVIYTVASWESNEFLIIGRSWQGLQTAQISDPPYGKVVYKSSGAIGIDILELINVSSANGYRTLFNSLAYSGTSKQSTDIKYDPSRSMLSNVGSNVANKTIGSVNNAIASSSTNELMAVDNALSSIPIIGTVFSYPKKLYSQYGGLSSTPRNLNIENYLGSRGLTGTKVGAEDNAQRQGIYDIFFIYTQSYPPQLTRSMAASPSSPYTENVVTGSVAPNAYLTMYKNYCFRNGYPRFQYAKFSDLKYLGTSDDQCIDSVKSDGVYIEAEDIYTKNATAIYKLPPDLQQQIIQACTDGFYLYGWKQSTKKNDTYTGNSDEKELILKKSVDNSKK